MHDKGIRGQVLIDTLDRYPQLTLNHHSTDTTVDTQSIHHRHLGQQSVDSRLIFIDKCLYSTAQK